MTAFWAGSLRWTVFLPLLGVTCTETVTWRFEQRSIFQDGLTHESGG